ncbi:glycosyltransferase [Actinomycetaceae bacterium MB13-C1-2]|nr:glycosyltransferase [Actinomycetaceae bacterium MB13-C1-2]
MSGWSLEDFRKGFWHLRKGGLSELQKFMGRRHASTGASRVTGVFRGQYRITHGVSETEWPEWAIPNVSHPRHGIRVGVIADDFSRMALQYEWEQVDLTPDNWRGHLDTGIDLLFVESAWHGFDGTWRYRLADAKGQAAELPDLVDTCRTAGIPSVFWNKEDPVHFADFLDTARLFDWVFTTEEATVTDYQRELGHDRIGVLPFAAQQSIHNPIRPPGWDPENLRGVAFAGTYFKHKYPERKEQMDLLLSGSERAVTKQKEQLDIYSRFAGLDPNYEFPDLYQKYVRGELSYPQMLTAYRYYRIFLNANSVPTSESMCGRRVFEISACGTPVLTCPTPAISSAFPDGTIPEAVDRDEAYDWARGLLRSQQLRDHLTHLSQREIWKRHTYTNRVDHVLTQIGMEDKAYRAPTVSAMIATNRPNQLEHVLGQMAVQADINLEVLVLCHGFELSVERKTELEEQFGPVRWIEANSDLKLGELYNILARAASGEVVAKIDDDDFYGPHYLSEQLAALDYSNADVVGKAAHHVYLERIGATVLRFPEGEHKYRPFVSGPTIVAKRQAVLAHPFPDVGRGEDTGFLKAIIDGGGTIFSSSRFEFMQVRGARAEHTWDIADANVLSTGQVVAYGRALDHVIF